MHRLSMTSLVLLWLQPSSLGLGKMAKIDQAKKVGALVAENAKKAGVESVVFDRNGYLYHGRVQALADAAREGGLKF